MDNIVTSARANNARSRMAVRDFILVAPAAIKPLVNDAVRLRQFYAEGAGFATRAASISAGPSEISETDVADAGLSIAGRSGEYGIF
jgi:hypothetical protein